MYVNPFWLGVLTTVCVLILTMFVVAIIAGGKKK